MRPLLLKMTAFGPFPETEIIDFSALGENPLFLINGPTGAGKTTILDAICFALYGKTTGDERDGSQMRCDLASADKLCEVSFEFELNGQNFHIRRVPEQQRPKSRGDGFTEQKPEAQLLELLADGNEKLHVASKVTEATREIENMTGLSVDQFRQVMILPQGKFRQLLLAESAEREKIFSKLFQTRIYKQLENRLKEQAAGVRRERESLQQKQQGILETIEVASAAELDAELEQLQPQVDVALAAKQQYEARFVELSGQLQQGRMLQSDFDQLDVVTGELQKLFLQQEQIDRNKLILSHALDAEKIRPFYVEQQRCSTEVERTEKQKGELQQNLETAKKQRQETAQQLQQSEKINQKQDQLKGELPQLLDQRQKLQRVNEIRQQKSQLQQTQAAMVLYRQLHDKEQQLEQLTTLNGLTNELKNIQEKLDNDKQSGLVLAQLHGQQTESTRELELSWHRGQAAILANELEDNHPCPVCGSLDHPAPANSETALPSYHDLETARQQLQDTTIKLEAARDQYRESGLELTQQRTRYEEYRQQFTESLEPVSVLETELQGLRQQWQRDGSAEIANLATEDLEEKSSNHQQEFSALETELKLLEDQLPEGCRQVSALDQRETELRQQLADLEKQLNTLNDAHLQALGELERVGATLQELTRQLDILQQQQQDAEMAVVSALEQSRFTDYDHYQKMLLSEMERTVLQKLIDEFSSKQQKLIGAQEQLQLSLKGKNRPDLQHLEAELDQINEVKQQADGDWKKLDNRQQILLDTRKKLLQNIGQLEKLDSRYAVIGTLSDVANGQTGQKISLQRFVLSVLLDEVLLEASQRFSLMSKGRYQLLRNEDRSKGNKASGLDLLVDDAYTGKVRSVATLSGGESFMAALSLALGLSNVVQSHAGGIHLDTLFIDEGFGSLDPESLDLAVRTLIDLQSSGRMIGVISHVADLKEQIPLRIDVFSDRLGSSTKISL